MLTDEQVDRLIRFVAEERRQGSDLAVEYQVDGLYLRVGGDAVGGGAPASRPAAVGAQKGGAASAPAGDETQVEEELPLDGHVLTSPMVGTFYRAPSPDASPYVEVGTEVEEGQVVCIVEAMKLMNEVEADVSGIVRSVVASNGEPVDFGAPLFVIET